MISDLQKEILRLSLERKFVTSQEFLAELWGCKGQEQATDDNAQYNVRHASLSRSLTRLWGRGLIQYWKTLSHCCTGITLTPAGKALALTIMAEAEKSKLRLTGRDCRKK
jgi:DNA-binding MarR family transcriptional regulator